MQESGAKRPPLIGVDPNELVDPVGKFNELEWNRNLG
jgi:hypothetical protein